MSALCEAIRFDTASESGPAHHPGCAVSPARPSAVFLQIALHWQRTDSSASCLMMRRLPGLQRRELQPKGRKESGEGADLICPRKHVAVKRKMLGFSTHSQLQDFQAEVRQPLLHHFCSHLAPCKAGVGRDGTAPGAADCVLQGSRGSDPRCCLGTARNI